MPNWNYFQTLCFFWALLGIGSRILMVVLGNRWNRWELESAYRKEKPFWLYPVGVAAVLLIAYSWYKVFTTEVPFSWIIATLVSLTGIKMYLLLFRYWQFRRWVVEMLSNRKKMRQLNLAVVIFSLIFLAMGIFLY